jgi:hypothetical protein
MAPTTTTAVGPLLSAPPSEPHIQVGLKDLTLILSVDGELLGHVQPALIGPEFYQDRQRRLTAEVGDRVVVPEDCVVDSVIEDDRSWWVMCDPDAASGPYLGVLSADDGVDIVGQLPAPPAGASNLGHWRDVFVRQDGFMLAQFSGECEIPHAMFIFDGVASHVSGEGFWDDAPVPNSLAFGWLPDGRALVWTEHEAGCGSSDPEPGIYSYAINGNRDLLRPIHDFPLWGQVYLTGE